MRISRHEVESAGVNLKAWLGAIQREAKEGNLSFALKGPVSRQVRVRRSGAGTMARTHAFFGDEQFRIGGVVSDHDATTGDILVSVTLIPAKMELAAQMSGMTMTLDECFIHLEGFEDWAGTFNAIKHLELAEPGKPVKKRLTLQEERELNPMWGRW